MEIVYFIILGIVQGLTEFLPVSSSGHLVLINKIFGGENRDFLFISIMLHIAILLSVVILYWKDIRKLLQQPFSKRAINLYIASFVTVIIVLCFKSFFIESFNGEYLSVCFMLTAIILMLTYFKLTCRKMYKPITKYSAFVIGLFQGLAILPGISRSGSTISAGVYMGASSEDSTSFSFILSIPIILGSLLVEIIDCCKMRTALFSGNASYLLLSIITAFIFGLVAIKIMKKLTKNNRYYIFSIYLIIISFISLFIW